MGLEQGAAGFIMRYLGGPLASIGMEPADENPRRCGVLFVGDGKLSNGSYFVWADGSGALVYIADFQVLESRPFSMEFPQFVSTFLERGMRCRHVEVHYLAPYFEGEPLRKSGATARGLARYLLELGRKISWSPEIARPFDAIEGSGCTGAAAEFVFSSASHLLMGSILEMRESSSVNREDGEAISRVVKHIEQNLDAPLRQEEMLSLAGMSATKFKALFKRSTRMSMSDYISRKRVARAKELLLSGEPVATVAPKVGFDSPAYFATFFRRATGQSPSKWRQTAHIPALPPTDGTVRLVCPVATTGPSADRAPAAPPPAVVPRSDKNRPPSDTTAHGSLKRSLTQLPAIP